jgi:subtilisin family serine protease
MYSRLAAVESNEGLTLRNPCLLVPLAVVALAATSVIASTVPAATAAPRPPRATLASTLRHHVPAPSARQKHVLEAATVPNQVPSLPAVDAVPHLDPALGAVGSGGSASQLDPQGLVHVAVTGSGALGAARAAGGKVTSDSAGVVTVAIRPSKLRALAGYRGVRQVTHTVKAITQDAAAVSQGVSASQAAAWQAASGLGNGGAGVNVGIVDGGFLGLAGEITAGNLGPTDGSQIVYPTGQDHCSNDQTTAHGVAVAEIVHQMAPNAKLYLYCVDFNTDFVAAANQIVANGTIKVVNSSLGFLGDARGDGFGPPTSTEAAVKTAREAGVLWIESAGNAAEDHWSGTLVDANHDGWADLDGTGEQFDATELDPGTSGEIDLTWDQWPTSKLPVTLAVQEFDSANNPVGSTQTVTQSSGTSPVLAIQIQNTSTTSGDVHYYSIGVRMPSGVSAVHYDLFYAGDVYPSYLSGLDANRAATGSMMSPATSPWAVAVGASYWNGNGQVETFSSRGPTIDGRVKPDLIGYDGVASNIASVESSQLDGSGNPIAGTTGFYGTSAAAPHVAGAAALIAAANPAMDASQIEAYLQAPANGTTAVSPPTSLNGHGLLNLGSADATMVHPALGSRYHQLPAPLRILYTKSGLGAPQAPLGAGTELTVQLPSSVPPDATSVVVSLSGVAAQAGTYLSLYPQSWAGNSTLNLGSTDPNATVTAIVGLSSHSFKLRNAAGRTDALINLLGYFGATSDAGGDGYHPVPLTRVVDTRSGIGAASRKLAPNASVTVNVAAAGVPADADVAVIDMTALNQTGSGYLTAFPNVGFAIGTVDYGRFQRANMALVPIVNGKFTMQNRFATADAIVDVSGYFSASATARYVALPSPVRIVNTATGTGGWLGQIGANSVLSEDAGGLYGVPYNVSGMWVGLTAVASSAGYLSIFPRNGAQPHTSDVGYTAGRAVPNGAIAALSAGSASLPPGFSTVVRAGSIQLYEDEYGYFVG